MGNDIRKSDIQYLKSISKQEWMKVIVEYFISSEFHRILRIKKSRS